MSAASKRVAWHAPELDRLVGWYLGEALPVWAEAGLDRTTGQFREALGLDGRPLADPIVRTRSAARQIYVFADAARRGLAPLAYLEVAEAAFAHLYASAWRAGDRPGYGRAIDPATRRLADPVVDLYDAACVLLALAALFGATGESRYRQHAHSLLVSLDTTLAASGGGWAEDEHGTLPRRQNPHMHLFEALLAFAEVDPDPMFRERLAQILSLLHDRFIDENGTLREFFGREWEIAPHLGSDRLDPGHMCEWAWLLRRYEALQLGKTGNLAQNFVSTAQRIGFAGGQMLVDEVSEEGEPLKPCRRLWLQAELVKALVTRFDSSGDQQYLQAADETAGRISRTYLSGAPQGMWRDNFNLTGSFIASTIPGSSLYHLWTAVVEVNTTKQSWKINKQDPR